MDDALRARFEDPSLLDHEALARFHELDDLGELHPDWAGVRQQYVEVAGARARLLRVEGDGTGPTTLLVHGLGGSASNWLSVMQDLAALGGDVVAVDLQGFGETAPPRPDASRPRNNARFVATLVSALGDGPVVLAGNSMGGLVSTFVAGTHPELVRHLVLLGPALPGYLPAARPSRVQVTGLGPWLVPVLGQRIVRRRLERMSFEERYDTLMREILVDEDVVPYAHRQLGIATLARVRELRWRGHAYRQATTGTVGAWAGSGRAAAIAAMRAVTAPTLYVRGAHDPLVLHATTVQVRRTRPDWTVDIHPDIAHVPMIEDPGWTVDRIQRFVAGSALDEQPLVS